MRNLSYLIESELEKAEIVLAAKSITDAIQKMAENAAKMEAEDVMPLNDPIREHFGPEAADTFAEAVGQALRNLTQAISEAKNTISNEIARMQGEVVESNDLEMMSDEEPSSDDDAVADDMPDEDSEIEMPGDEGDSGEMEMPRFDDEDLSNAAGRARKESAVPKKKILESPDAIVARQYAKMIREGKSAKAAAKVLTETYAIDIPTLVEIIEGSRKK